MQLSQALQQRRTIKRFADRQLSRAEIETILAAATLGPEARHAYGLALGERKARKIEDPTAAQAMRETVAAEHRALPGMIAVAVVANENPEIREEDYAAVMMGIENLMLAAVEQGLGTAIKTGAVMADPAARAAAGVRDEERIVAIVNVGEPAELPPPKKREAATAFTTWMP
jgi:nitroreductase